LWIIGLLGEKRYTFGEAMTHSTKLMEARRKMRKEIMNCIVPCRRQTSMLDLQAIDLASNKENLPLAPDPQRRRSSP